MNLKENLEPKYVAFLDVLGFKEIVSSDGLETLEAYYKTIQSSLGIIENTRMNIDSLFVSDSIILTAPEFVDEFKALLTAIEFIQFNLSKNDIWLRGGITFGDVYYNKDSNIIVGQGLINAYQLEKEAKYPRVIIDPKVIRKVGGNRQEFLDIVNPDYTDPKIERLVHIKYKYINEDSFFVSYGHRIILSGIDNRNLDELYDTITKNLYSSQKHYDKYLWLKNYLLDVLRELADRWEFVTESDKEERTYIETWWTKFTEI